MEQSLGDGLDKSTAMNDASINNLSQLSGKRIMVTGATGFIGKNICQLLSEIGAVTVGTCFSVVNEKPDSLDSLERLDLLDVTAIQAHVVNHRPDAIVHLGAMVTASRDPDLIVPMLQSNLISTINLLDAARTSGVKRVVLAGSLEEPAAGDKPNSPYAASKGAQALYGSLYESLGELEVANVKIAMGYGCRQNDKTKLIPYVIGELLNRRAPAIASGDRQADWIFESDIANGIAQVLAVPVLPDHKLQLATGKLTSVREVVESLVVLEGSGIKPEYGAIPDRKNESANSADPAAMHQSFGWKPQVDLFEGLRLTWEWHKARC